MPNALVSLVRTVHRLLLHLETFWLALLLVAMIGLACFQIGLRLLLDSGFLWLDPLLRYLVIWAGLFGALAATGRGKHICLDLVSYLLPARYQPLLRCGLHLFSAVVCGVLAWAAVLFVQSEMEFGGRTLLGLGSWVWNLAFPVAFGLISLRFLAAAMGEVTGFFTEEPGARSRPANGGTP